MRRVGPRAALVHVIDRLGHLGEVTLVAGLVTTLLDLAVRAPSLEQHGDGEEHEQGR